MARNWFQVPNAYEQLSQDQKQRAMTWMIAPGYQHTFNDHTLLTVNPFVRRDQINYYASRDPFADNPSTAAQNRFLTNYGLAADLTYQHGIHTLKLGTRLQQTRLLENFQFGITNPAYNPVCLNAEGNYLLLPGVTNPNQCSTINPTYMANPNLQPGLVPYDLTRGGSMFFFHGKANINQYGFFAEDTIKAGKFHVQSGFARRPIQRPGLRQRSSAAAGDFLSDSENEHGAARRLRQDIRDSIQREPDPFERYRRRRTRAECLRLDSRLPSSPAFGINSIPDSSRGSRDG